MATLKTALASVATANGSNGSGSESTGVSTWAAVGHLLHRMPCKIKRELLAAVDSTMARQDY